VSIVWGAISRRAGMRRLIPLGFGGIAVTAVVYVTVFNMGALDFSRIFGGIRYGITQKSLDTLVPLIEDHKVRLGEYPLTLEQLRTSLPRNAPANIYDLSNGFTRPRLFYYRRVDPDHYYLRGLGPDGKPFTPDDLLPHPDTPGGLLIDAPVNRV